MEIGQGQPGGFEQGYWPLALSTQLASRCSTNVQPERKEMADRGIIWQLNTLRSQTSHMQESSTGVINLTCYQTRTLRTQRQI